MAREYAKELTWEERWDELNCQFHVTGQQVWRVRSLIGKVEMIISDSPIITGCLYSNPEDIMLRKAIIEQFNLFDNINYLLNIPRIYNPKGRRQTVEESKDIKSKLQSYLDENNIDYKKVSSYDEISEDLI